MPTRLAPWLLATSLVPLALASCSDDGDEDTAADGSYDFTGVAPGTYTVSIDVADLPVGAVWAEFCARQDVPVGAALLADLTAYQASVSGRE